MQLFCDDDDFIVTIDMYCYKGSFASTENKCYKVEQLSPLSDLEENTELCNEFVSDLARTGRDYVLNVGNYYVYIVDGAIQNRIFCYPFTDSADIDDVMEYIAGNMMFAGGKFWTLVRRPEFLI